MALRFDSQVPQGKFARGMASEAVETLQIAYAHETRYGYYHRISTRGGDVWRWVVEFSCEDDCSGHVASAEEAKAILERQYEAFKRKLGFHDVPANDRSLRNEVALMVG